MNREETLLSILQSMERFQEHIADILDARAGEAVRAANWLQQTSSFSRDVSIAERMKMGMEMHEGIIESIEAITRMERALSVHLALLLNDDEDEDD